MKIDELKRECERSLTLGITNRVVLVIPKGMYPRRFPRGYLLLEKMDGSRVYSFDAARLLDFLERAEQE